MSADPFKQQWEEIVATTPCDCPVCRSPDPHAYSGGFIPVLKCKRYRRLLRLDKKPGDSLNHPAE